MQVYTIDQDTFHAKEIIDGFTSLIWTERFYGDGDVVLVVPDTERNRAIIPEGALLRTIGSDVVMIVENRLIENESLKVTGISLLAWLNNRIIRATADHKDRYWTLTGVPGYIISSVVFNMCCSGSPYLDSTVPININNPGRFIVPGLFTSAWPTDGEPTVTIAVPYGPVYDPIKEIGVTYATGLKIQLNIYDWDPEYFELEFFSYKGVDRTTGNPTDAEVVRFSPKMESLTDLKELDSIAELKTSVFSFAPNAPEGLPGFAGEASLQGEEFTGFNYRAKMTFEDDLSTDVVETDTVAFSAVLDNRALKELAKNGYLRTLDGTIVPLAPFVIGVHYGLGDIVEVEGRFGEIQRCQVMEHIRTEDAGGASSYPTLQTLGITVAPQRPINDDWVNRIVIACPGKTVHGTTRNSTTEADTPPELEWSGKDVWYEVTTPFDGLLEINLTNLFGTWASEHGRISVWKDPIGGPAASIADIEYSDSGYPDGYTINTSRGDKWYISIDSDDGSTGDFSLEIVCQSYKFARIFPSTTPTNTYENCMVYDSVRERIVMFDPYNRNTYEYYDDEWHLITTATTIPPDALTHATMAYDEVNEICVLRVKQDNTVPRYTAVYTYDGSDWTQRFYQVEGSITGQPDGYYRCVWVPTLGKTLFLGAKEPTFPATTYGPMKTWTYDGSTHTFTELTLTHHPTTFTSFEVSIPVLVYDPVRDMVVCYTRKDTGGVDDPGPDYGLRYPGSTWELDPSSPDWVSIRQDQPDYWGRSNATFDTTLGKIVFVESRVDFNYGQLTHTFDPGTPGNGLEAEYDKSGPIGLGFAICDFPPIGGTLGFGSWYIFFGLTSETHTWIGKVQ